MTEKELIQQLKTLKQIKPSKEWAILRRQEILGIQTPSSVIAREPSRLSLRGASVLASDAAISRLTRAVQPLTDILSNTFFKPAFATIACFGLIFTLLGVAQSALPGDLLYPAKKITEKVQLNLAAEQEKPDMQIAMTNKKMQELNQVVQANLGKNLAPAIQEVEQSAQQTAKTLEKLTESVKVVDTSENIGEARQTEIKYVQTDTVKVKEIATQIQEIQKIESTKQVIQKSHGVIVETPELDAAVTDCYKTLVEMEIETIESQILTQEQEALLQEIKELMAQEQYQQAFEKFLIGQ